MIDIAAALYIGIDPAIASAAFVALTEPIASLKFKSGPGVLADGTPDDVNRSLDLESILAGWLIREVGLTRSVVITIEGGSFGRDPTRSLQTGVAHDAIHRAVLRFPGLAPLLITVPPKTLKRFAADNGNAGKPEMRAAILARWPEAEPLRSQDEREALAMAHYGRAVVLGSPPWVREKALIHTVVDGRFVRAVIPNARTRRKLIISRTSDR